MGTASLQGFSYFGSLIWKWEVQDWNALGNSLRVTPNSLQKCQIEDCKTQKMISAGTGLVVRHCARFQKNSAGKLGERFLAEILCIRPLAHYYSSSSSSSLMRSDFRNFKS